MPNGDLDLNIRNCYNPFTYVTGETFESSLSLTHVKLSGYRKRESNLVDNHNFCLNIEQ